MRNTSDFLSSLTAIPSTIQIGEANNVLFTQGHNNFWENLESFLSSNKSKNLYFCANVDTHARKDPRFNRCRDADIKSKNYIYLDLDIRKAMEAKGIKITDDEIKGLASHFAKSLEGRQYLSDWSDIVFTGNGLHIYYIDAEPTPIDVSLFGIGYEVIRRRAHGILGYEPDSACKNPARIARVPGSYNNKAKPKLVEIILSRNVRSKMIPAIMRIGAKEKERLDGIAKFEDELREIRKRECLYSTDEIIQKINAIPIEHEILRDYPSWRFDGKNFWNQDKSRASSAFVGKNPENVLIISDSRWFAQIGYKGVGTFLYRRDMSGMTNVETVQYFKDNYNIF
jgi:hypothetical protein